MQLLKRYSQERAFNVVEDKAGVKHDEVLIEMRATFEVEAATL